MAKRGLGKGLGAFFGEEVTTTKENAAEKVSRSERKEHLMVNQGTTKNTEKDETVKKTDSSQPAKTGTNAETIVVEKIVEKPIEQTLKLNLIEPNSEQPRKNFDEESLQELADSIKQYGILQPLIVQKKGNHYEIIAGERRWRAAKLAGVTDVPVLIREYDKQQTMEIALIENVQRADLNPIEEAQAYKRLLTEFHLKQDEVQKMVVDDMISTGHARALISIEDPEEQYLIAQKIFDEKLSVREVEKLVKDLHKPPKPPKEENKTLQAIYQEISERLKQSLSTKVSVSAKQNGAGKIEIEFYNHEDLERLLERITG